jgi:hypothetical protein
MFRSASFQDPATNVEFLTMNRNFAENVGITFHTPEEFFLHEEPREFSRSFNPSEYLPDFSAAEGWL